VAILLSNDVKEQIWVLHEVRKMNNSDIAHQLGVARNTVIKVLKDRTNRNAQFMSKIKKVEQESNENLLKMLQEDTRIPKIFNSILNRLMESSNIDDEIGKYGLKSLTNIYGVLADKHLASKKLMIEERAIDVKERTLELKEEELKARIENPDAFATVQIINDAPREDRLYGSN